MINKKIFVLMLLFVFSVFFIHSASTNFQKIELPKNILIVSQSSQNGSTVISAIDLDSNELLLIYFQWDGEYKCYKTGIKCDPNKQQKIDGKSAQFNSK